MRKQIRPYLANFGGTQFGNQAIIPAPWLKYPKGIRDLEEWFISLKMTTGLCLSCL